MTVSSKAHIGRFKLLLLLFNFIVIQSAFHVVASTPKPKNAALAETLPPPAINITINSTQLGQPSSNKATPIMQGSMDESSGVEYEGDLDSSAADPDLSISRKVEEQLAAPSFTTVHQVWASSSSDSLDELSPEVISKLRNDVPFLAAYSIRPRLVGASTDISGNNRVQNAALVNPTVTSYTTQLQAPSTAGSETAALKMQASSDVSASLQSGAASSPQSTLSKLGNFNEFKVETSSSSKSEHHHKRKTVLKRKNDDQQPAELRSKRRQVYNTVNQLKAERRRRNKNKRNKSALRRKTHKRKGKNTSRDLQRSGRLIKRAKSAARRNQAKTSRLRLKLNGRNLQHHMRIIKHGRYLQEQPGPVIGGSSRDGKTSLDPVKGGNTDMAIKGGSADGNKKSPFYSRAKPASKDDIEPLGENQPDEGLGKNKVDSESDDVDAKQESMGTRKIDEEEGEGDDGDDESLAAPLPEPRRVGDDDVEEDGDTVTVMPKYDGVDDDPEPIDDDGPVFGEREESGQGEKESNSNDRKSEGEEDEPRARRVDRERPNDMENGSANGGNEQAFGGGVGATVGGASRNSGDKSNPTESGKTDYDGERAPDDSVGNKSDEDRESAMKDKTDRSSTGVSGDDPSDNDDSNASKDSNPGNRDGDKDLEDPRRDQGLAGNGNRREEAGSKTENGDSESKDEDSAYRGDKDIMRKMGEEDLDVDYRDEMAVEEERKTKKSKHDGESSKKETPLKKDKDCDDGSYSDHNHHRDHGDHHHDHHDTIKWLQDAVPGEPGEDYPILSKVNSTNFNCRDQKYPGYYADVEARCQIFHICQADGRQDSFLSSNTSH